MKDLLALFTEIKEKTKADHVSADFHKNNITLHIHKARGEETISLNRIFSKVEIDRIRYSQILVESLIEDFNEQYSAA
jgi:hypothetical protein